MTRRLHDPEGQAAHGQRVAFVPVPLVFLVQPAEGQLAAHAVGHIGLVDIDRQIRPFLQKTRHTGAVVKVAVGQQDHDGGAAAGGDHGLDAFRLVAGIDDGADLRHLVAQDIAVGHDGAYHRRQYFHHSTLPYSWSVSTTSVSGPSLRLSTCM